ncbi:sigma-70 family RNA polymerase sigma factor [Lewinella sp. W8]|uniref:RNA polymerase sigma factor n=1 Tax=Lewinella sp. W8 TaxID=2528208 RepID=UPI001C12C771
MAKTNVFNDRQDRVLALLRQRRQEGMQELFTHYGGALLTIISKIIDQPEVAEEVLHDVLLKVWNNIDQYDASKSRFFTWMARISRNAAVDKVRSKGFRKKNKTDSLVPLVSNSVAHSETPSIDQIGVSGLLTKLDQKSRGIIELLYLREFTQSEVAKELDLPLGTVKTRARRAILQLRELLKHEMVWLVMVHFLTQIALF